MNRIAVTRFGRGGSSFRLGIVTLVILAAVIGSVWLLSQSRALAIVADESVDTLHLVGVPRAADAYSNELDTLRQQAASIANRDAATAYGVSLETLARAGREAYVSSRPPSTANAYVVYLDSLRQQGQAAFAAHSAPANANDYSEWLDQLRRMGQ